MDENQIIYCGDWCGNRKCPRNYTHVLTIPENRVIMLYVAKPIECKDWKPVYVEDETHKLPN